MTPKKQTQLSTVKRILKETGKITRNQCLSMFISRLGAYVNDLNNEGWEIEGKKVDNDYIYTLKTQPHVPKVEIVERIINGITTRVAVYK